ncbi:MAG TPA: isochorismatase family protein [Candidatus Angelobacter sp.]|nr:isochorismatase family protein [Candidatus Angelobacter sp.]
MTQALLVVDAQNEFSKEGKRPVPNHMAALAAIHRHMERARMEKRPIAWVRHHNKPHESPAFIPGSWGAELSRGLGPKAGFGAEAIFEKDVYGAFHGTGLEGWLHSNDVKSVLVVGFYTHMCLSTSVREALVRGFEAFIDPEATGARELEDEVLGFQSAEEVRRSTLLHLTNMGAQVWRESSLKVGSDQPLRIQSIRAVS